MTNRKENIILLLMAIGFVVLGIYGGQHKSAESSAYSGVSHCCQNG